MRGTPSRGWVLPALLLSLLAACQGPGDGDKSPSGPPPGAQPLPLFRDVAPSAGLTAIAYYGDPVKAHLLESTGGGLAAADFDGDRKVDLYFTTAQTMTDWLAGDRSRGNSLYRNNGDGTFTDVAGEAGVALTNWSTGAYFVDYDNDGDKDLYVTAWGPNTMFRNDGNGTFSDVTGVSGLAGDGSAWSTSAAFGDLDNDGDLDLYVANYCVYDPANPPFGNDLSIWKGVMVYPGPRGFMGQPDVLYRNNGDGTFSDISGSSGFSTPPPLFGLGGVFSDLDDDGDLDLFVANDSVANQLWRNDGGLSFTEIGAFASLATNEDAKEQAGMGADAGDYDGDGRIDLVVTNFSHEWNTLHRNEGELFFVDTTFKAGFRDSYLRLVWGTKFLDYDHDGWLDLVVANGHIYPEVDDNPHLNTRYRQPNTLYRNLGDGSFEDVTDRSGPGFEISESTRGLAVTDIDDDGDLDMVLGNMDVAPNLLINDGGDRRSWISVRLVGLASNRDGVGARLTLYQGQTRQVREVNPFGSYQSQSSYRVHFGLGDAEIAERLVVRWPSGTVDELSGLQARRHFEITEGRGVTADYAPDGSSR